MSNPPSSCGHRPLCCSGSGAGALVRHHHEQGRPRRGGPAARARRHAHQRTPTSPITACVPSPSIRDISMGPSRWTRQPAQTTSCSSTVPGFKTSSVSLARNDARGAFVRRLLRIWVEGRKPTGRDLAVKRGTGAVHVSIDTGVIVKRPSMLGPHWPTRHSSTHGSFRNRASDVTKCVTRQGSAQFSRNCQTAILSGWGSSAPYGTRSPWSAVFQEVQKRRHLEKAS